MKYITQTGKKYNPPELILVNKFTKVKIYKIYKNEIKIFAPTKPIEGLHL